MTIGVKVYFLFRVSTSNRLKYVVLRSQLKIFSCSGILTLDYFLSGF